MNNLGKKLYKVREIAKLVKVDTSTVTHWIRTGKLQAETIDLPVREGGKQYLIMEDDLLELLQKKLIEYQETLIKSQERVHSVKDFLKYKEVL